jgi:hypothetical protein
VGTLAWEIALDSSERRMGTGELAFDAKEGRLALDVPSQAVVVLHAVRGAT